MAVEEALQEALGEVADAAIHHVAAAVTFGLAAAIALGFLLHCLVRSVHSIGRRCLDSCCSQEKAGWKGSRGQLLQHMGQMGSACNRYDVIDTCEDAPWRKSAEDDGTTGDGAGLTFGGGRRPGEDMEPMIEVPIESGHTIDLGGACEHPCDGRKLDLVTIEGSTDDKKGSVGLEQGRYQGRQSPTLDLSALDQLIARNHDLLGTSVKVEAEGSEEGCGSSTDLLTDLPTLASLSAQLQSAGAFVNPQASCQATGSHAATTLFRASSIVVPASRSRAGTSMVTEHGDATLAVSVAELCCGSSSAVSEAEPYRGSATARPSKLELD